MAQINWKQSELRPGDPGIGDVATQLFEGRNQMRLEIFVREDLQNRVDARRDNYDGPVKVRIAFQTLPPSIIAEYFPASFQDWYRRTETQNMSSSEADRRTKDIANIFAADTFPVLIIEDFNTSGLNGPVNSVIPEKDPSNPLHHPTNALTCFFRRNGKSGKTDKKLGSAGLGRHVYYKASLISSKLVYTVPTDLWREQDSQLVELSAKPLFFGQSFQHELAERDGNKQRLYSPYHRLSSEDGNGLPMPFGLAGDDAIAEKARQDFRLTRRADEPGCSLIIPFPKTNFTSTSFINSIVRDFPMPILSGMLEVEIDGQRINAATLSSLSDKPEVNQHNAFLSEAIGATPSVTVFVDTESLKKTLSSDLFNRSDLHSLANSYNGNEIVCVKVDIKYGSRDDQKGSILVSARKADAGGKGRHVVVRTGLVLSSYSDRPFCKASNAIVRVQSDSLGSLLRRVETPSHSEWIPGDIDPYDCDCATELIAFVKTAHGALDRVLANLDTEEDVNIFSDLLPAGPRKPESVAESPFSIILEDDGQTFKIETAAQYNAGPNTSWRLQLTYDSVLGSGRARKGYRLGTFDLQQVPINVRSGKVKEKGNCHVEVSIADPSRFLMKIGPCGFAGWADVRFHAMRSDTGNIQ